MAATTQTANLTKDQLQKVTAERVRLLGEQEAQLTKETRLLARQIAEAQLRLETLNSDIAKAEVELARISKTAEVAKTELDELIVARNTAYDELGKAKKDADTFREELIANKKLNQKVTLECRNIQEKTDKEAEKMKQDILAFNRTREQVIDYLKKVIV